MKMDIFYKKKLPRFIKNCILPTYKKLQPPKSAIIRNSIFEINRDPCASVKEMTNMRYAQVYYTGCFFHDILTYAGAIQRSTLWLLRK